MTQLQLFIFAKRVNRAAFIAEAKKFERLALIKALAEKRRRERPC